MILRFIDVSIPFVDKYFKILNYCNTVNIERDEFKTLLNVYSFCLNFRLQKSTK